MFSPDTHNLTPTPAAQTVAVSFSFPMPSGAPAGNVGTGATISGAATAARVDGSDDATHAPLGEAGSRESGGVASCSQDPAHSHGLSPHRDAADAGVENHGSGTAPETPSAEDATADRRLTPEALEIGAARARALMALRRAVAGGMSQHQAAVAAGVSDAQASRLLRTWAHLADDQVTPETLAGNSANCGRRSPWELTAERPEIVQTLQRIYLQTIGASAESAIRGRRTGSAALALERFADHELCPPDLARALRRGVQPKPLLAAIRAVTPELESRHRGHRHAMLSARVITRTSLIEVLSDGTQQAITAGDWWVFDDMSDNQPFWFDAPVGENGENVPLVGRQGLYAYDVTRRWIGLELLGTPRDSYTAAIILRFIRRLMQSFGRPRRGIVLEQSVWGARAIRGFRLTTAGDLVEDEYDREALPSAETALIQDGIRALGIEVHYARTPRGKEIEGAFNYLQRVAPTFAPENVNIGRHRGEFERGAKALRRAHAGVAHPRDLGFASIDERAELLDRAMQWINARGAWQQDGDGQVPAYPTLAQLSRRDLAAFLPHSAELALRGGRVTTTVQGRPLDFCAPELFAEIGAGFRLFVRFDAAEPAMGAAIYNRETSSANRRGWQVGEFIGWADYMPPVARFDWSDAEDPAAELRRRHAGYVRTAYRAVGLGHKAATVRDGRGRVAQIETGKATAATNFPDARTTRGTPAESTAGPELNSPRSERSGVNGGRSTRRSAPTPDPRLAEFYEEEQREISAGD